MFDFASRPGDAAHAPTSVMFLSNPFGTPREWTGLAECLGARAVCRAFDRPADFMNQTRFTPGGAHLVAHGTGAYHAMQMAMHQPHAVRSVTLIDPDIIFAMPDLMPGLQFRRHLQLVRRTMDRDASGCHEEAAESVIDWWMGRKAWSRTSPRLRARFAKAIPALTDEWRTQWHAPIDLAEGLPPSCPVKIVTGQKVKSDVRALARILRMAIPGASVTLVKSAQAACHLTDPHLVGPEIGKFVVSSDARWHTMVDLAAA